MPVPEGLLGLNRRRTVFGPGRTRVYNMLTNWISNTLCNQRHAESRSAPPQGLLRTALRAEGAFLAAQSLRTGQHVRLVEGTR